MKKQIKILEYGRNPRTGPILVKKVTKQEFK